jgi:hypothetical protein
MDHMAVGQDESVWREYEARSAATGFPAANAVPRFNVDDRRAYPFRGSDYSTRVSVKQLAIVQLGRPFQIWL